MHVLFELFLLHSEYILQSFNHLANRLLKDQNRVGMRHINIKKPSERRESSHPSKPNTACSLSLHISCQGFHDIWVIGWIILNSSIADNTASLVLLSLHEAAAADSGKRELSFLITSSQLTYKKPSE